MTTTVAQIRARLNAHVERGKPLRPWWNGINLAAGQGFRGRTMICVGKLCNSAA